MLPVSAVVFSSPRFADHLLPPGHPESPSRARRMQQVASEFAALGGEVRESRAATDAELARVHDEAYIAALMRLSGRSSELDGDTFTSPDSVEVARLAAGAAVTAVDAVLLEEDAASRALVMVRPPGHHAERDRAMGFCLLNNVAVAAAHARAAGLARVAIVDYDVHHGNGTQWAFYDDPSVLFISTHQFPYYPGTGAASEIGRGAGTGFTVNLPLAAGAGDADLEVAYQRVVLPVLEQFRPELVLVSAGFDGHLDDPLGALQLSTGQYARLTRLLVDVADRHCGGRLVAVTEGGYDLEALGACLRGALAVLDGRDDGAAAPSGAHVRGSAAVTAVRSHLGAIWTLE